MEQPEFAPKVPYGEMTPAQRLKDVRLVMAEASVLFPQGLLADQGPSPDQADLDGARQWLASGRQLILLAEKGGRALDEFAREARVDWVLAEQKKEVVMQMAAMERGFRPDQTCFMGRDLADLAAMRLTGFTAASADAHPWVREVAYLVCRRPAGQGALGEALQRMLSGDAGEGN